MAVAYGTVGMFARALLVICFYFLTAPVASHIIARAAYRSGVPIWDATGVDEFREVVEREGGNVRMAIDGGEE